MMKEVRYACDKCGLGIEPLDDGFNGQQIAGDGSLVVLARVNGGIGHNQVRFDGWHFHYLCFCDVVTAIKGVLNGAS
jgi:hypothetical protein